MSHDSQAQSHAEADREGAIEPGDETAGGWGSVRGIARILGEEIPSPGALETLGRQNKPGGHMCTSCSFAKPKHPHRVEVCENGAKATLWELTSRRCGPDFFAAHSVGSLLAWSDYELEQAGRLTHPMRYDPHSDHYVPASWDEAFAAIGASLRALDPKSVVFYASGRASLETSYLYALYARLYGHNNLPDSSNMCHETTSVGLKDVIGSPVGTCVLEDFDSCDMILFFGQNTGTNSPRFLHNLQAAAKRGCKIVTFNPVREAGLLQFTNPLAPSQMLTGKATPISDRYLQVRPGGDIAALIGLCKAVLEAEEAQGGILDREFIDTHSDGFGDFAAAMRAATWAEIVEASGLAEADLREVAQMYMACNRVIGIYGMGLTQHVHGSQSIAMLNSLLMLRGNLGKPGAGISPIRGHSNVQGQRTVGISEKPKLVPLKKLAEMFGFSPPEEEGTTTVTAVQGILDGTVRGFVSLGGNFARAIPDQGRTNAAWAGLELNVQIATKLNRSHLLVGRQSWLLPCLARSEEDMQETGPQWVSMEDTFSHIHGSLGKRPPASDELRSELAIVAGMAEATLPPNPKVDWRGWTGDYARVRDLIAETYPDEFYDYNARFREAGGFYRGNPVRSRVWKTDSGKAHFLTPTVMMSLGQVPQSGQYTLVSLRSNDQFNTTIYGDSDRLRGLDARDIVLMNAAEIAAAGLTEGQRVTLICAVADGHSRRVAGLRLVAHDLPRGCVGAYYPEVNPLIPLDYYDLKSKTPAYKGVPVRLEV